VGESRILAEINTSDGQPAAAAYTEGRDHERERSLDLATGRFNADSKPSMSWDSFCLALPPPAQTQGGVAGPGVGAGRLGSSGQFAI